MGALDNWKRLQAEIAQHAVAAQPITVICVSKGVSVDAMLRAYAAGARHFGESRLQEALSKQKLLPQDVIWHYIGPIQSNKTTKIAAHFSVVHSIGSMQVAKLFSIAGLQLGRAISCFIQVNTTHLAHQQGISIEELSLQMPEIAQLEGISIQGFMTIAPHTKDEGLVRQAFRSLALLQKKWSYPYLSMGMSQDFRIALEEGATHIRIGSYLFS